MSAEFVDTNIVLYSLSDDATKRRQALAILVDQPVLSLQVLNEAANIMWRKLGFDISAVREVLRSPAPLTVASGDKISLYADRDESR